MEVATGWAFMVLTVRIGFVFSIVVFTSEKKRGGCCRYAQAHGFDFDDPHADRFVSGMRFNAVK
jgi:hypothetical protein